MIGSTWTSRGAVLRLSAMMPVMAILLYRLFDPPLSVRLIVAAVAIFIIWLGFVAARIALNEHHVVSPPPFPSRSERR